MSDEVENFLEHYGVKGMKWGVTKDRDRSSESRTERKASAKAVRTYMFEKTKDEPLFYNPVTKDQYDKMSTGREFVSKNATLKRITMTPEAEAAGRMYVSKLPEDSNFYKAVLPAIGPQTKGPLGGGKKAYKQAQYEVEMKVIKKLSAPSEKERIDTFMEILEQPVVKVGKKEMTGREFLTKNGYGTLGSKKLSTQEYGLETWNDFVRTQGKADSPINTAYFDKIKEKGFNALPDDYDRGRLTKAPLILLDPEGTIKVKTVRKLTTDEINRAQRELRA